ncbi:MAG: hypothetical protein K0R51_1446 [Cytophagaceae bacterium]|jgi:hypothetical protein|nr:hypothetical protein [Cytophagaceae bacterium]
MINMLVMVYYINWLKSYQNIKKASLIACNSLYLVKPSSHEKDHTL